MVSSSGPFTRPSYQALPQPLTTNIQNKHSQKTVTENPLKKVSHKPLFKKSLSKNTLRALNLKTLGAETLSENLKTNWVIKWLKMVHILLPKLFWPTVRKNCSSDQKKTFEIWGWRPRICKIFEIFRTIYSNHERSEQFLVTESLFLEVSHIW